MIDFKLQSAFLGISTLCASAARLATDMSTRQCVETRGRTLEVYCRNINVAFDLNNMATAWDCTRDKDWAWVSREIVLHSPAWQIGSVMTAREHASWVVDIDLASLRARIAAHIWTGKVSIMCYTTINNG